MLRENLLGGGKNPCPRTGRIAPLGGGFSFHDKGLARSVILDKHDQGGSTGRP
jgi:hypothetical protein